MSVAQPEPGSGPTVRRILLGYQLRQLRESKNISRADAAYKIRGSESKISRVELGRVGFKIRDVEDLLTFYGVDDPAVRSSFLTLAREANEPGWWHKYGESLPIWFQSYVGMEEAATQLRVYETQFVPGLLQTEDYAREVITRGGKNRLDVLAKDRIATRMRRQHRIRENPGVKLWVIIDEPAVRRPVGNAAIMRAQLQHLKKLSEESNITLQIVPFSQGVYAAETGSFTILRYPEYDLPDVVYVEQLTGGMIQEKRAEVEQYTMALEWLAVVAERPEQTRKLLDEIIDDQE
ncbi:helix-turn-helix domain-containing protein [Actinorugispora endophytica]|uniref:Helix-turn-helix protein n=1 Tax=Actinorugispora endophytica TaxID=1605990 RepID=A0A4R6UPR9_9ACTN|nr:helix-turn-helix transcriptional regulator [Actinorugispora endophytica]TDQ49220.1 helix-turn-helix protein [Actinorugispora endophytica]